MKISKPIKSIATLAMSATAVVFLTAASGNAATSGSGKAEIACQQALNIGSSSALRAFLRTYRNSNTACNALASTASAGDTPRDNSGNRSNLANPGGVASSDGGASGGGGGGGGGSGGGGGHDDGGHGDGGHGDGGHGDGGHGDGGHGDGGHGDGGGDGGDDDGE